MGRHPNLPHRLAGPHSHGVIKPPTPLQVPLLHHTSSRARPPPGITGGPSSVLQPLPFHEQQRDSSQPTRSQVLQQPPYVLGSATDPMTVSWLPSAGPGSTSSPPTGVNRSARQWHPPPVPRLRQEQSGQRRTTTRPVRGPRGTMPPGVWQLRHGGTLRGGLLQAAHGHSSSRSEAQPSQHSPVPATAAHGVYRHGIVPVAAHCGPAPTALGVFRLDVGSSADHRGSAPPALGVSSQDHAQQSQRPPAPTRSRNHAVSFL